MLDAQRHLFTLAIDSQNGDVDFVANLNQLDGMVDPFDPGHFADVHQALDTRFQFDEGTVAHHVDDFALVNAADRVFLFDVVPRIGKHLLHAQGDLDFLAVDIQDLDVDLLIDGDHVRRDAGFANGTCR